MNLNPIRIKDAILAEDVPGYKITVAHEDFYIDIIYGL